MDKEQLEVGPEVGRGDGSEGKSCFVEVGGGCVPVRVEKEKDEGGRQRPLNDQKGGNKLTKAEVADE